ncbi:hypothetical protein T8T21_00865 [Limimaricola variabilis]|uniref:hypothetical protein n=1 Tax=Limimaricola variabilis TaxID=1492771 RepID=UPI002AC8F058|nr:hypothetical protein [Limimaricola variabilis]WPY94710.1 hypothetical protein T8T21_00865 [Limimaricola variabilis]
MSIAGSDLARARAICLRLDEADRITLAIELVNTAGEPSSIPHLMRLERLTRSTCDRLTGTRMPREKA